MLESPTVNTDHQILEQAFELCMEHLKSRSHVGQLLAPAVLKEKLGLRLGPQGISAENLQADMKNFLHYSTNTLTPTFQNQLFSGLSPYALAGDWLSTVVNATMATYEASPVGTLVEKELIASLNDIIGWKNGDGIMVTGGSNANLVSLLLARNTLHPNSKTEGLKQVFTVFVSEESHYSFDKAMNLMGMGLKNLIRVPADSSGRMIVSELKKAVLASKNRGETPFYVAATAGTTVFGAFDPIEAISKVATEFNLWLHVDGAWGGSCLFSSQQKHLLNGVHLADSMTWDTHKMLGTGLISSFFLTKHQNSLKISNDTGNANYIFHDNETSDWDMGPSSLQCGRRIDAFKVWLMWRALGHEGLEKLVNTLFEKAQMARELIQGHPELELIHEGQMLNICFRYKTLKNPNDLVIKVRKRLLEEGHHFVNYSHRGGVTFFRMIFANPDLEKNQTENFLSHVITLSKELDTP